MKILERLFVFTLGIGLMVFLIDIGPYRKHSLKVGGLNTTGIVDGTCGGEEGCSVSYSFRARHPRSVDDMSMWATYKGAVGQNTHSVANMHDSISITYLPDDPTINSPTCDLTDSVVKYP